MNLLNGKINWNDYLEAVALCQSFKLEGKIVKIAFDGSRDDVLLQLVG